MPLSPARILAPALLALLGLGLACPGCSEEESGAAPFLIQSPHRIEITGSRYHWEVRYPGPDGRLHTEDDVFGEGVVHAPLGHDVELVLHSDDYIYTLALPHLGLKEIAVPELEFELAFQATEAGTFELLGDQMCGYAHADLVSTLVVAPSEAYVAEMRRLASRERGGIQ